MTTYVPKPDHRFGPCCSAESCDYLADRKDPASPWLCDEHYLEWQDAEIDRLRDALTCVAQDCAHLEWNYQGKWASREFQRVGRIAEDALPSQRSASNVA